ncbi:glutathione S-transferase [Rhodoferax koreense]|uniref:Glutathione S-transferase n=1 Tax=Rhodoferax koreensis TaxID=1842727 RepID=A0A1P8JXW5_9BURK|nr:glutathione S-transferase [Rhodoferax koreense]APW38587.1 glutathione S-transferase [Rhodoferax koreense]
MAALPVLYSFRRCPYAMRARLALRVSGQVCELREVVLRDKPAELRLVSAKATVPVLVDADGSVLEQSLDIMRWALTRHDPEDWLVPPLGNLDDMLALIEQIDGPFKFHLDRYKYPQRYPETGVSHREAAAAILAPLQARLSQTTHLFGSRPALADMAIAPFVRQFAHVDADWFSAQAWPELQAWLSAFEASDLLAGVMHKYPAWRAGTPGIRFG